MKKLNLSRLAKNIKKYRNIAGLSASELARNANIARWTLSLCESGSPNNFSLNTVFSISEALNVSISDLFDDSTLATDSELFFVKFGDIRNLTESDKKILRIIINRMKKSPDSNDISKIMDVISDDKE